MAYILPQVQVFQHFTQTPTAVRLKNSFVFGEHYQVVRDQALGAYDKDSDTEYSYPSKASGAVVDTDFTEVVMSDIWARYATIAESSTNPMVSPSSIERNKLRAAPRIDDAEVPTVTDGVDLEVGGYFTAGYDLPESFYFTPYGGWSGSAWASGSFISVLNSSEDAKLSYVTTEGYEGTVDVDASDTPLTADVNIKGPSGIVMDFDAGTRRSIVLSYDAADIPAASDTVVIKVGALSDVTFTFKAAAACTTANDVLVGATNTESFNNLALAINKLKETDSDLAGILDVIHLSTGAGAGTLRIVANVAFTLTPTLATGAVTPSAIAAYNSLRKPITLTVSDVDGNGSFALAVKDSKIKDAIDAMVATSPNIIKVEPNITAGALAVALDTSTLLLTIDVDGGTTTLADLRAELVADSDIAAWFTISAVTGDDTETVDLIYDETGHSVADILAAAEVSDNNSGSPITMVRDAYKVTVRANSYTFATGNGFNTSSHFKSRGVRVGDRIKWTFIDDASDEYTGVSKITGLEADYATALIEQPTVSSNNKATEAGTTLGFKGTGADVITAGTDNQRDFDGVNTKLYSLDNVNTKYLGEYNNGILAENIKVTITTGGAAGTAKASVVSTLGTYNNTNVPIVSLSHDTTEAAIFIGRNMWVNFDQGAGDADAIFQVGDTYMFDTSVLAPYTAISTDDISSAGDYEGLANTTYVVEVVRGGVFNRAVDAVDGLVNGSEVTIAVTADIATTSDTITVGSTVFEFGAASDPSYTQVAIGADLEATLTNLRAAVNASTEPVWCSFVIGTPVTTGTITFKGVTTALGTVAKNSTEMSAPVEALATFTPAIDWTEWAGDVNDEYILKCTKAGTIATAEFSATSQRGDTLTGIRFDGSGSSFEKDISTQGLSGYFTLTGTGTVTFSVGDYWVVNVFGARPQVKISDTAGIDQSSLATVDDTVAIALGSNGATITFAANTNTAAGFVTGGGLCKDEVFYVEAIASEAQAIKTLVLADDLPSNVVRGLTAAEDSNYVPTRFAIDLYLVQASNTITSKKAQDAPNYNWVSEADKLTVYSDIAVQDASFVNLDGTMDYLPIYRSNISILYRALMSDYSDAIYSITDISDVATQLGEITTDNPLAMGVYQALLNSGSRSVYFMAVPTANLAGYLSVLDRAELNDIVYSFAPLTRNTTILDAVEAHIDAMSTETEKKWRIGFFGTELPTTKAVYTATTSVDGSEWQGTVGEDPERAGEGNLLLTITSDDPEATSVVKAGDRVLLNFATDAWGDATYETYTVLETPVSNTTIKLATGPSLPIGVAQKFELWHDNSTAEMATAVAALSTGFSNKRIVSIFPSEGYADGTLLTSEYAAAQVAGLASSVAPQQGLTNVEINGYTDLPMVYSIFTKDQLNEMAEAGTMILMQHMPGGRIYIRHQLTSAASAGNLNTSELSMIKNLDSISYYFANILTPYIGIYNVTPELVEVIETQLSQGISYLTSLTSVGLLGPQLLAEGTEITNIQQHPVLKDHISCTMNVALPAPFNVMELHLVV